MIKDLKALFSLGKIVSTPGALSAPGKEGIGVDSLLKQWGKAQAPEVKPRFARAKKARWPFMPTRSSHFEAGTFDARLNPADTQAVAMAL